jgi:hypothetical protein
MATLATARIPLDFFQALQHKHYDKVWSLLSRRSQSVIVRLLAQNLPNDTISSLETAFANAKEPAITYWKHFAESLDLNHWIQQKYQSLAESEGEVLVKCSPSGVHLRIIQETNGWKFGYIETFMDAS